MMIKPTWIPGKTADSDCAARSALTALIVDDEVHVRAYTRMLLASLGVTTVWEASGGEGALALYAEQRPSVVLLDVNMPTMPGEMMMTRLVEMDPDAAVIMLTTDSQIGVVRRFQELGALGYLIKHSPREQLKTLLAELLDGLLAGYEEE
jgi:two-component system invasion response regulator UvrY